MKRDTWCRRPLVSGLIFVLILGATSVALAQDPLPRPFNLGNLDVEEQVSYFMYMLSDDRYTPDGDGHLVFETDLALSVEDYQSLSGGLPPPGMVEQPQRDGLETVINSQSAYIVVGNVLCSVQAHNPHIGTRFVANVKAKANGHCSYTPKFNGSPQPSQHSTRFTLHMLLASSDAQIAAARSYEKRGWNASWDQNDSIRGPGAQVDTHACRNGTYENSIVVSFRVPSPFWTTAPFPGYDARTSTITRCPH